MKIYHFCADKLLWRILKDGLTMGGVVVPEKKGFVMYTGWVWLTCDPIRRIKAGQRRTLFSIVGRHGG